MHQCIFQIHPSINCNQIRPTPQIACLMLHRKLINLIKEPLLLPRFILPAPFLTTQIQLFARSKTIDQTKIPLFLEISNHLPVYFRLPFVLDLRIITTFLFRAPLPLHHQTLYSMFVFLSILLPLHMKILVIDSQCTHLFRHLVQAIVLFHPKCRIKADLRLLPI